MRADTRFCTATLSLGGQSTRLRGDNIFRGCLTAHYPGRRSALQSLAYSSDHRTTRQADVDAAALTVGTWRQGANP